MRNILKTGYSNAFQLARPVMISILFNIIMATVTGIFGLPIYFDTAGTICVSMLGGFFPGILTAVVTNIICSFFDGSAMYFTFINALAAMFTVWYARKYKFDNILSVFVFMLIIGIFSGVCSSFVQWGLFGGPVNSSMKDIMEAAESGKIRFLFFLLINIVLSIFDKSVCTAIALAVVRFIPAKDRIAIRNSMWKQRPLTAAEANSMSRRGEYAGNSLRTRIMLVLIGVSAALVLVMGWVMFGFYSENIKNEKTIAAANAAKFAAEITDGDKVADYLVQKQEDPQYQQTEQMLGKIVENTAELDELYVIMANERGITYVFDLSSDPNATIHAAGKFVPADEVSYSRALLEDSTPEPMLTENRGVRAMTAFCPVYDSTGKLVCYSGANVSFADVDHYMGKLLFRIILVIAGFLILIVSYAIWTTNKYIVFPINSMAACVDGLIRGGDEQENLDENVRRIEALEIHTDDEVEKLYQAICRMTANQAEQMRDIRYFTDSTAKMQDGLIITMANMVENRDSDTGAHIQKTADYVRIIVEGLKKKGYYADKIDTKYMSDVVRSAPLHDVGKINISDTILNKPGKLTDEEYEIMKTHTTAGKQIIENAINMVQGENYLKEARNMAAYHHERWDGKGYPEKLKGEVIPLSARIMAVADVFDALTSPRVYKPAFPLEKALNILREGSGTQFDPKCIEVFMESLPEVKKVFRKYNQDTLQDK